MEDLDTQITEEHQSRVIECKTSGIIDKEKCKWYRTTQICVKPCCCKRKSCCDQSVQFSFGGRSRVGNSKIQSNKSFLKTAQYIWYNLIFLSMYGDKFSSTQKSFIVAF